MSRCSVPGARRFPLSNPIAIDEAALADTIAKDPVLAEIERDRAEWRRRQGVKEQEWQVKIVALRAQLKPLKKAITAANRALRSKQCEIARAQQFQKRRFKQFKALDRRETKRRNFLRLGAVEKAVAVVRKELCKEQKLAAFV